MKNGSVAESKQTNIEKKATTELFHFLTQLISVGPKWHSDIFSHKYVGWSVSVSVSECVH